jgi:glycosyltransferase involved in cell wall biosynthesis
MLREKVAEAAFVVSISEYNKDLIITDCGDNSRDKVVVIHCGVDTRMFRPTERPQRASTLNILCVGTLYEVKGQTYLIDACRLLKERGIDFACQLVGDGPEREKLAAQIARDGLGEQVHMLGRRTRDEIAALLAQADVVVTPSVPTRQGQREGIPVVLMEAMGSGVPVIASGMSGIPELVEDEHSGLLIPPRDAQALADSLQRLYEDPSLRQRLARAGREKVEREFDLNTNATTLGQHFSRLGVPLRRP